MKLIICAVVAAVVAQCATANSCAHDCSDVKEPVCGSDGVTYSNECKLSFEACKDMSGVTKVSDGECPTTGNSAPSPDTGNDDCSFACLHVYDPVYDDNGNMYSNECEMRRAQCKNKDKTVSSSSSSSSSSPTPSSTPSTETGNSDCSFACFDVYRPVTDEDGKTYSNECYMRRAKCKNN
ncbi:hypothetical protein PHYBOEH_008821 [Phytophthora boehmeriae]|uniref:Kazal-like domain-containing protein n=1 Tax=Phytophthora boehmeriae TaxID=109152 RepID=A0A8T1X6F0_9STRA|nr:hypothetical protein PHYBOEH_008821 [Phytophthora boehmeriae]